MSDSTGSPAAGRKPRARHAGRWAVLGAALLAAACGERRAATAPPAVPVVAATAERRTVPIQLDAIGNVETVDSVAVKPQVEGQIVAVRFREGRR